MKKHLVTFAVVTVVGAGLGAATPAVAAADSADGAKPEVVSSTTNDEGVKVTRLSDGSEVRSAPEGSAEAKDKSCGENEVCFWKGKNYTKHKLSYSAGKGECQNFYANPYQTFYIKSFKTGKKRGISSIREGRDCKGKPSASYRGGVSKPNYGFAAKSFT